MAIWLPEPLSGTWGLGLGHFPPSFESGGRVFHRALWRWPYPDVVEQYREDKPRHSMHLKITTDGRWIVDHIDEENPDFGRVIPHFLRDVLGPRP